MVAGQTMVHPDLENSRQLGLLHFQKEVRGSSDAAAQILHSGSLTVKEGKGISMYLEPWGLNLFSGTGYKLAPGGLKGYEM